MINEQQYTTSSLALHMFFARIMKEHAIFLAAGFTPADTDFSSTAAYYQDQFEEILLTALQLGNGMISPDVVSSGEIVTDYTLESEQKTQLFTGIAIDQEITKMESTLHGSVDPQITAELAQQVKNLNAHVQQLLDEFIDFKAGILDNVLSCSMFTANYPLYIDHVRQEAQNYKSSLLALANGQDPNDPITEGELFWDDIMMEHALFIQGQLDPTESDLIMTANHFAADYSGLLQEMRNSTAMPDITDKTLQETLNFRDFKESGTKGILACQVRSVILPLLADHVLREANHYIRLLRQSVVSG